MTRAAQYCPMPVFISRIAGRCGPPEIACITVCTNAIFVCGLLSVWRGTMKSLTNQPMHFEVLALSLYAHIPGEIPAFVEAKNENSSRSEEHTSELQSLMLTTYAVFSLKKNRQTRQVEKT